MTLLEENAEVLREIAAEGTDLSVPFDVDFVHVFENEDDAHAFAAAAQGLGFIMSVDVGEDDSDGLADEMEDEDAVEDGIDHAGDHLHDPIEVDADDVIDEDAFWEVVATRNMVPDAKAITDIELQLAALAESHGGGADGWGFMTD